MDKNKTFTQAEKQARGDQFEAEFRASCNYIDCWAKKILNGGYGTPFDFTVTVEGGAHAIELKRTLDERLAYSAVTKNEREGLDGFIKRVSTNTSWILCNIKNENENRAFLIPWRQVRGYVLSGQRGSLYIKNYAEVPRILMPNGKYGWDLKQLEGFYVRGN